MIDEQRMKVLFVNTNDTSGGAARAAMRIMRGVQQSGEETQMFVKYKNSQAEDVVPLSQFVPSDQLYRTFEWIVTKIKNQWQHHKWRPYKHTKLNLYFSDLRSTRIHGALQKMEYDILHLHWINNRFLISRSYGRFMTHGHLPVFAMYHMNVKNILIIVGIVRY